MNRCLRGLAARGLLPLAIAASTAATAGARSLDSDTAFAKGVELHQSGKYAEAIPFFEKADSLEALCLFDDSSADYPVIWIANCYYNLGDTSRARELYPNLYMLPPVDRRLTQESDALCEDALICLQAEDYPNALELAERCGDIESRALGENHYYYGNTLSFCAGILGQLERHEEAISYFERAIDIFTGYDIRFSLADSYIGLANVYVAIDSLERAYELCQKAILLLDGLDPTLEVAILWAEAGSFFSDYCYDFYASLECAQRGFDIADALAPHDGIFYADACNALGTVHCNIAGTFDNQNTSKQALGAYQKAFTYCARADSLYRLLEETDPVRFAQNLCLLALSGCKSEQPGHQALVREATDLWRSQEMAPLYNTFTYYAAMRLYLLCNPDSLPLEQATERLYSMAQELFEQEDVDMQLIGLDLLMDILTAFQSQGDHQQLLRDNMFLVDEIGYRLDRLPSTGAYERAHIYHIYANTLINDLGDSERAIDALQRAKTILEEEGADTTRVYRETLSQLGQICMSAGRYYEAYTHLSRLVDLTQASVDYHARRIGELGIPESEYINALESISFYFNLTGDFQRADYVLGLAHGLQAHAEQNAGISKAYILYCARNNQLDKALSLFEQSFSAEYDNISSAPVRLMAHELYALLLLWGGTRLEEAERQLDLVMEQGVMEDLPVDHTAVVMYEYLRAAIAYQRDDLAAAERHLKRVAQAGEASETFNLGDLAGIYTDLQSLHLQMGDMESVADDIRHATAHATNFIRTTFRSMNYAERAAFWDRYAQWFTVTLPGTAYRLRRAETDTLLYNATLMSKGLLLNSEIEVQRLVAASNDPAATALSDSIQLLYAERKRLTGDSDAYGRLTTRIEAGERKLVNLMKSYGDYTRNLTLTWRDVQARLAKGDAAVEFILSPLSEDSLMYSALVLKAGTEPARVELCSQNELTAIPTDSLYTTTELTSLIWDPLEEELKDVKNIYFAPQGLLYSMAIEYAPTADGYISDRYNLYRLSSTREIVLPHDQSQAKSAALYGGLSYSADTAAVIKANLDQADLDVFKPRAALESIRDVGPQGIGDLAYTLEEVEKIESMYSAAHEDCHSFKGVYGTEESFKSLSGTGKTLLHLATHGFYYTQTDYDSDNSLLAQAVGMLDQGLTSTEDKMLTRSGLFLTGVNAALTGQSIPNTMEDGILTAQEIAFLDFRDVDLVVLSACQSAMGELGGDGVFGLQRGFKKAGAKTLLMSLWNVDDKATQLLMTEFYKNWLGAGGMSKREAFLKAQERLRDTEKYKDSKYWAAFIMLDGIN